MRVPETLPKAVLKQINAPPKPDVPVIDPTTLESYEGFLLGIPTRFGNFPVQWKAFWDATGPQWGRNAYHGKYAGLFISTANLGGGQESTAMSAMSTLSHHGIIYVPLGYKSAAGPLTRLDEVRGGSPWGAGTFAVSITLSTYSREPIALTIRQASDGSRQPSELELEIARLQGQSLWKYRQGSLS